MEIKLYDTLKREKRTFVPIDASHVRMYVCGPTVYDLAHIGNARPLIVFDVLFRLLRHVYGENHVTYVRNITDVDDKINARAARDFPGLPLNEAIRKVTEETENQFHRDVAALGCLEPTFEPRATEHIRAMKQMIERLVANGCAYVAEDHVLFDVAAMPDYGRLSNRSLDDMIAGARVEVAPYKRNATDFVLWKPSKAGEPAWDSPCGIKAPGRPGWHIECSAMADYWLWENAKPNLSPSGLAHPHEFDIHGGGIDLVFPHHENEIAQSRCAFHTDVMANYWMHNGFLQVEGEKMAKSLGNFVTIHELLNGWHNLAWPGEVIRLAMLMTHYRQPIDFSERALEQANLALTYFKEFGSEPFGAKPSDAFMAAMEDDLNTPLAIAELHHLSKLARGEAHDLAARMAKPGAQIDISVNSPSRQLWAALDLLGVNVRGYESDWAKKQIRSKISDDETKKIRELVEARTAARARKDFKESDRIRDELAAMGVALKDGKDAVSGEPVTTWEVTR